MLLDSFAWMEHFMGTPAGRRVRELLKEGPTLFTSPVVLAEVFSRIARLAGQQQATARVDFIVSRCALVPVDEAIGRAAGALHAERKVVERDFGLADALIVATARSKGVKVLTGDPHILALPDGEPLTA